MMRILLDKLEERMKGTPADGTIEKLFVGKIKSYIRCMNIDYESSREEDFYDLQVSPFFLTPPPPPIS
jgi:ubiquitin carboxyl-terminal hydrolase 7